MYLRESIHKIFLKQKAQLQANLLPLVVKIAASFLNGSFPWEQQK